MKKADIVLIVTTLSIGLILFFTFVKSSVNSEEATNYLTIRVDGEIILNEVFTEELSLSDEIIVGNNINGYLVEDGFVEMTHANCPDQKCVMQGRVGVDDLVKAVICAPNNVVINIESSENIIDG